MARAKAISPVEAGKERKRVEVMDNVREAREEAAEKAAREKRRMDTLESLAQLAGQPPIEEQRATLLLRKLGEYFSPEVLHWKPQAVSGNRALAVVYLSAREVMDRLDEVVGPLRWQDTYSVLPSGAVQCRLSITVAGVTVTREDVGGQSEQPDEDDRLKAAFSDALKRAAVKFGIGRYLYSFPKVWCDYDPQEKRFVKKPIPPAHFLPGQEPWRRVDLNRKAQVTEDAVVKAGKCKPGSLMKLLRERYGPDLNVVPAETVATDCRDFRELCERYGNDDWLLSPNRKEEFGR